MMTINMICTMDISTITIVTFLLLFLVLSINLLSWSAGVLLSRAKGAVPEAKLNLFKSTTWRFMGVGFRG